MKVYTLRISHFNGDFTINKIKGIYSTKELAKEKISELTLPPFAEVHIKEYELDV